MKYNEKRDFLFSWLSEENNRRNLKTWITIFFSIILIVIYRGFRFGLTLEVIFNIETLLDLIIVLFVVLIVTNDLSERADYDEIQENDELKKINDDIDLEIKKIKDFKKFAIKIEKLNKERYKNALEYTRNEEKEKLNILIAKNYNNKEKIERYEELSKNINKRIVKPKNFEYYTIDDFLGKLPSFKSGKEISIKYKSKSEVKKRNLSFTLGRVLFIVLFRAGIGVSSDNIAETVIFLLVTIPIVFTSALLTYENVRYDKRSNEKVALKKKYEILKEMEIDNEPI